MGLHTMKHPAGSRLYPCVSLSSLNPSSPSVSSDASMPDLIPDLVPTGDQVPGENPVPVEDIPLPGKYSATDLSGIMITPTSFFRGRTSGGVLRHRPLRHHDHGRGHGGGHPGRGHGGVLRHRPLRHHDHSDIPLPGEYSAADFSGIAITPIKETRVINSAISLPASLIRQEPLPDRDILRREPVLAVSSCPQLMHEINIDDIDTILAEDIDFTLLDDYAEEPILQTQELNIVGTFDNYSDLIKALEPAKTKQRNMKGRKQQPLHKLPKENHSNVMRCRKYRRDKNARAFEELDELPILVARNDELKRQEEAMRAKLARVRGAYLKLITEGRIKYT